MRRPAAPTRAPSVRRLRRGPARRRTRARTSCGSGSSCTSSGTRDRTHRSGAAPGAGGGGVRAVAEGNGKASGRSSRRSAAPSGSSLGPTNGAGRMTALAPHPTDSATRSYAGSAGGGVWKSTDAGATWIAADRRPDRPLRGRARHRTVIAGHDLSGDGRGGLRDRFHPGNRASEVDGRQARLGRCLRASSRPPSIGSASIRRTPNELVVGTNDGSLPIDGRRKHVVERDLARRRTATCPIIGARRRAIRGFSTRRRGAGRTPARTRRPEGAEVDGRRRHVVGQERGIADRIARRHRRADVDRDQRRRTRRFSTWPASLRNGSDDTLVSHVYKSTNGGDSGRICSAVVAATPGSAATWRSRAGTTTSSSCRPRTRTSLIAGGTTYIRTTDGGTTFSSVATSAGVHVDAHDLKYQGSELWIGNDGGIWTSTDDGVSAHRRNDGLVTRQFYSLAIDPVNRNRVLAGAQDNGTGQRTDAGGTTWRPSSAPTVSSAASIRSRRRSPGARSSSAPSSGRATRRRQTRPPSRTSLRRTTTESRLPFLSILKVDPLVGRTRSTRARTASGALARRRHHLGPAVDHDDGLVRLGLDDQRHVDRAVADRSAPSDRREGIRRLPIG